ncbi:MAG: hypothetical protein LBI63_03215 [Candidatus Ancillula sp.]|jgi:hypothetical protein|nr:hypothetical protein [Candidatus Ancillula sp.]
MNNITNLVARGINLAIEGLNDGPAKMPPGFQAVSQIFGWGKWVAFVVCIGCLIGFFAHLATERQNGGGSGSIGWLGKILLAIIGISATFGLVGAFIS